jgi:hypothetical protein
MESILELHHQHYKRSRDRKKKSSRQKSWVKNQKEKYLLCREVDVGDTSAKNIKARLGNVNPVEIEGIIVKNSSRDATIGTPPSPGASICVDLDGALENFSSTTYWATMRDIFPGSVTLDVLKTR